MKYMTKLQFEEIIETGGDCFARYLVRMKEMRQSLSIIEQLIDNIPEGEFPGQNKSSIEIAERRILFRELKQQEGNSECILSVKAEQHLTELNFVPRIFQSFCTRSYGKGIQDRRPGCDHGNTWIW